VKRSFNNIKELTRVWVVDDDADCRMLTRAAIVTVADNISVREVEDGVEALELLDRLTGDPSERPDLIVLDVDMPGISGMEVLRAVKAAPVLADIPVVMFTASEDADLPRDAMRNGAAAFHSKPIAAEVFQRTVVQAVRRCLPTAKLSEFHSAQWRKTEKNGK